MSENQNVVVNEQPVGLADNFPMILNSITFKYLKSNTFTLNDSITTHETEGGVQEDVTARRGRKSIAISGVVLQDLLASLLGLQSLDEFQAQIYDPLLNAYDTILVRVAPGSMSYTLKEKSANLKTTNGVWNVAFTLEEF